MVSTRKKRKMNDAKGAWPGSYDLPFKFLGPTPETYRERVKVCTSNFGLRSTTTKTTGNELPPHGRGQGHVTYFSNFTPLKYFGKE